MSVISTVGGAINVATSGTAISTAAAVAVQAGDIIVVFSTIIPLASTSTFSKASGTATIGPFSKNVAGNTNSNAQVEMAWCFVTGSGTIDITVTSSGTITNGTIIWEAYRGTKGVGQTAVGGGATGTDATLTLTTQSPLSWCVLGCTHNASTAAAITAGANTVVEQHDESNTTGTSNDLSTAMGSNESDLVRGTSAPLHLTVPNNAPNSTVILELVTQDYCQPFMGLVYQ